MEDTNYIQAKLFYLYAINENLKLNKSELQGKVDKYIWKHSIFFKNKNTEFNEMMKDSINII